MESYLDRPLRVVVADDHPFVLAALVRLLRSFSEVIASVANGTAAIETVDRERPDVLVVDLMMPDMNGLEVCRRVKQAAPDIEVVIVTAFDDPHMHAIASQHGAAAFVAKHAAPGTLERTLQQIFAGKQSLQS